MGNGVYAKLMPYDKWVRFNNAQRAHYNMVEQSAPVLACLAGAGLYYPRFSAALGFAFSFGRVLYAYGYNSNKGADGRLVGVIIAELATLALFGSAIYAGASTTGLVDTVKALIGR
jgi:glutathione S-transferase